MIFVTLFAISMLGEVLSNDRPLVVRYEGHYYFPIVKDYSETLFGGDFPAKANYLDPYISLSSQARIEWQLRHLSAESFSLRHDRLFRGASVSGAAHEKQLARHRSVRARCAGAATLRLPFVGIDGTRAHGVRCGDWCADGRGAGFLRRPHRSDRPAADRNLEFDARSVPADHLRVDLRTHAVAVVHSAFHVRLAGVVGLCARTNFCATVRSITSGQLAPWASPTWQDHVAPCAAE